MSMKNQDGKYFREMFSYVYILQKENFHGNFVLRVDNNKEIATIFSFPF